MMRHIIDKKENLSLPKKWDLSTIGNVAQINVRLKNINEIAEDTMVSFVPMAAVDASQGQISHPQQRKLHEVKKGFTSFQDGDIIFAKITPCMENGKSSIVHNLVNGIGFGSTEFHVISPSKKVMSEWIYYFIRQTSYRELAKTTFKGTAGQLRVPVSFISQTIIPLPPLPDQQRIIAKIEELFSQLDAAEFALKNALINCQRFRNSYLKSVFSKDQIEWEVEELGTIFKVGLGGTPSRENLTYWNGDIPWISSGEVRNNRIKQTREKITRVGERNSNAKLLPVGTVLLAMIGEGKTRGQTAVIDIEATTNQNVAAILPNPDKAFPDWIFYWLLSRYDESRNSSSGGMQYALNSARIRSFKIPLPQLELQKSILIKIEEYFSTVAALEMIIKINLKRLSNFRQKILEKAFSGDL